MAQPTQEDIQSLTNAIQELAKNSRPQRTGVGGNFGNNSDQAIINILRKLSIQLPGGARIYQPDILLRELTGLVKPAKTVGQALNKFAIVTGAAASSAVILTKSFTRLSKELGGITPAQAFQQYTSALGQSISGLARGRILFPGESLQIQGAFAQEFGGLISPQAAALLQEAGQDLGLNVGQLVNLERVLQGTGRESRATINEFRRVGVNATVAAEELAKNGTAVARAGSNFNSFIVEGIKNAKRLGLEFGKIEQTLTGFATDFEGTVEGFANLRAVIPGFAIDFNQLFSTALYGSTDDFIEQMRGGLLGAGITDISQLNRLQVAQLEKTTGFTGEQLNRILKGQEAGLTFAESLDTERNSLLGLILAAVSGIGVGGATSSIAGPALRKTGYAAARRMGMTRIAGMAAGAALGLSGAGAAGLVASLILPSILEPLFRKDDSVDDAIIQNGKIIGTNPADTIIATKTPEQLGTQQVSVNMSNLESKMDKLVMFMEQQLNVFKNGMFVEMRDMDKAIIRQQEATIRNY